MKHAGALAWPGLRAFRLERRDYEDRACTQCSFYFAPVDGKALVPFLPGQFLSVRIPLTERGEPLSAGERGLTRCYSLSDKPSVDHYRITVKRALAPTSPADSLPGLVSNHLHDAVHVGDIVQFRAPSGRFVLDADASSPAALIAGGVGITPLMSMLRWCVDAQPERPVYLYYGVRNGEEHAFEAALVALSEAHPQVIVRSVYFQPGPTDILRSD